MGGDHVKTISYNNNYYETSVQYMLSHESAFQWPVHVQFMMMSSWQITKGKTDVTFLRDAFFRTSR